MVKLQTIAITTYFRVPTPYADDEACDCGSAIVEVGSCNQLDLADTDGRDDSRMIKDEVAAKKLLKLPSAAISDDVSLLLEGRGVLSPECRLQR